jgi:hypothetical protein
MKLYVDSDRYGGMPAMLLVEAFNNAVRDLVRRQLTESGGKWTSFVFGDADSLITKQKIAGIEERILATGHRFSSASAASLRDRPEAYRDASGLHVDLSIFSFEHPDATIGAVDDTGREQRGTGDNVVRHSANVSGIARHIRSSEQVIRYMQTGVPVNTIAIVDDSGCTLTAPIIEQFKAVICAGGTVRSHLGILTREYDIPCLMNARISGIREGDPVEIESSAAAKTAQDYQSGHDRSARIWRLKR